MGEKGSGKTAYAVFLENNSIKNHRCQITTMTETQYKRFIELKKQGKLAYSDYANIWRSMLLFLVGKMIIGRSKGFIEKLTGKFNGVEKEIEKWSQNALNPEVESAFEAITSASFSANVGKKDVSTLNGELKNQESEKSPHLRHYLLETENSLKDALSSLSLKDPHILFIDGIDYRPENVAYIEYIECIKGLAEAVWQLNTDFFKTIRDTKSRIKIVLLVRPDVFHALNIYNSNSRLQDNTIYLDWSTNEREYRNSNLYELSGRYFSMQNKEKPDYHSAWNHYYNDDSTDGNTFKKLLRTTFQKPRDILTFIKFSRDITIKNKAGQSSAFSKDMLTSPTFTRKFSDYLLGETKNYAAFYMTQMDFQNCLKFFQHLNGSQKFSFSDFEAAFIEFKKWATGEKVTAQDYFRDPEALLQFFYDTNIIGYTEEIEEGGETFYHWSYRERSLNNIAPKIKSSGALFINPGISKALDIGKSFKKSSDKPSSTRSKTEKRYQPKRNKRI
jgi:hypothetical protein